MGLMIALRWHDSFIHYQYHVFLWTYGGICSHSVTESSLFMTDVSCIVISLHCMYNRINKEQGHQMQLLPQPFILHSNHMTADRDIVSGGLKTVKNQLKKSHYPTWNYAAVYLIWREWMKQAFSSWAAFFYLWTTRKQCLVFWVDFFFIYI